MTDFLKRTWAVINLDCLDFNIKALKNHLSLGTKIMAVVKADGYGHGDHAIAEELSREGVDFFAVSNLAEARSLRRGGIHSDILILGFTPPSCAQELADLNLTQTVFSSEYAELLSNSCQEANISVKVHIKLDTGMNRIGFPAFHSETAVRKVSDACRLPNLHITGIFTHLSSADTLDDNSIAYTQMQVERFSAAVLALEKKGVHFSCRHMQNSAGIAFLPSLHYDYVPVSYTHLDVYKRQIFFSSVRMRGIPKIGQGGSSGWIAILTPHSAATGMISWRK